MTTCWARSRRALQSRRQPLPPQVTGLSQATVTAAEMFGDFSGDNYLVELTLPGEVRATMMAYVTRVPHLYLKDAFFIGERLSDVRERYRRIMASDGFDLSAVLRSLDPADVRAGLEQALAGIRPDVAKEPEEGDQWPLSRPIVEFVISLLPETGQGYDTHGFLTGHDPGALLSTRSERDIGWDDDEPGTAGDDAPWVTEDGVDLVEEFLSAPRGAALRQQQYSRGLTAFFMTVAAVTEDDPLYWSADMVEWVLEDVVPGDPVMPPEAVDLVPAVLPALVDWAHELTGVDPDERDEVHAVMRPLLAQLPERRAEPRYRAVRLDAMVERALHSGDDSSFALALLAQRVGGYGELEALDVEALPAEGLDLSTLPGDVVEQVREVDAELVAGVANLGAGQLKIGEPVPRTEFLVACRRFLVWAVAAEPEVMRRRASSRNTAAAVAWLVGRGNELVGHPPAPVRTTELWRAFEVKSAPSSRADTLMAAAWLPQAPSGVALGTPDLLVASARAAIVAQRDRLLAEQTSSRGSS